MEEERDIVIELNVGGKIIETLRSTLTLVPDSTFARQFAVEWKESSIRDKNGRYFIDEDAELVRIIIDYLRDKKKEDPSNPLRPPNVREEKKAKFVALLEYYGLTEFFREPQPAYWKHGNFKVIVRPNSSRNVYQDKYKIQLSQHFPDDDGLPPDYAIVDAPLKADGDGSFWKITTDELGEPEELYTGIIGNLSRYINRCQFDSTTCGWAQFFAGRGTIEISKGKLSLKEHIPLWSKGECRFFHFKKDKLTMFSTKTRETFEMSVEIGRDMYIYIDLPSYNNYTLTIEPILEEIGMSIFR